ncbi:MAG: CidA/LrgA family protein [Pseudomonadota bacterium]
MIEYLTLILACQLAGELLISSTGAPLPGPVAGMILLFVFLVIKGGIPDVLGKVSDALLGNLSLLFVPAGVGVMSHLELLGTDAVPLSVALIVSTALTIIVTAVLLVVLRNTKTTSEDKG